MYEMNIVDMRVLQKYIQLNLHLIFKSNMLQPATAIIIWQELPHISHIRSVCFLIFVCKSLGSDLHMDHDPSHSVGYSTSTRKRQKTDQPVFQRPLVRWTARRLPGCNHEMNSHTTTTVLLMEEIRPTS